MNYYESTISRPVAVLKDNPLVADCMLIVVAMVVGVVVPVARKIKAISGSLIKEQEEYLVREKIYKMTVK